MKIQRTKCVTVKTYNKRNVIKFVVLAKTITM